MTKQIDKSILEAKPIFFVSTILSRALGIEKILPNFHIITFKKDPLIPILRKLGRSILCLEEKTTDNIYTNSLHILDNKASQDFIKEKSEGLTPNILTFRSIPQIAHLCKTKSYNYLQSDPFLVRELEDKVLFQKLLLKNGIKIIPSQIKSLENCEWMGERMVLQLRRGFAGNSSFLVNSQKELNQFKAEYAKHQVKLSPFIDGITLTLNACILENNIRIGKYFTQIENEPTLNSCLLGTVGNSHFAEEIISNDIDKKVNSLVNDIADVIKKKGFRGFFGLDIRVSDTQEVYPIECNPRLTASVGNYTSMQFKNDIHPFLLSHINHFLHLDDNNLYTEIKKDFSYSFLTFRNISNRQVQLSNNIKPGTYILEKENIRYESSNLDFYKTSQGEFVLLPMEGNALIDSNKEYAYLLTKKRIYKNKKLTKEAYQLIGVIKKRLLG